MDAAGISAMLDEVKKDFKDFVKIFVDSMQSEIREVRKENGDLRLQLELSRNEIDSLKNSHYQYELSQKRISEENVASIQTVDDKIRRLDDISRQNNLRFEGLDDIPDETFERSQVKIEKLIKDTLMLDIAVNSSQRIGKFDSTRPRTVLVRFSSFGDRQACLRASSKLKGTSVYINEDLSRETLSIRKSKLGELKELRDQGFIAFFRGTEIVCRKKAQINSTEAVNSSDTVSSKASKTRGKKQNTTKSVRQTRK